MAFLIQELKACQPLTHFKPDCVKEWEAKKIQKKIADVRGQEKEKKKSVGSSEKRDKGGF